MSKGEGEKGIGFFPGGGGDGIVFKGDPRENQSSTTKFEEGTIEN